MQTRAWCDHCDRATRFEPHPTIPYAIVCGWCGRIRVERNRATYVAPKTVER